MYKHDFNKSVILGDAGERKLIETYSYLKSDSTDGHDMLDCRDGSSTSTIEVKTDFYDMNRTPNFFMERYSDDKTFKLGGPWRSESHNTDVFLYQFITNLKMFWFGDIPALVAELDSYISKNNPRIVEVPNIRHTTLGYKIPRHVVADLYIELDFGDILP